MMKIWSFLKTKWSEFNCETTLLPFLILKSLGDAKEVLLEAALINKNIDNGVISTHRLVQAAVLRRLNESEGSKYFEDAVCILNWGFPDIWSKDVGHQKKAWARCEKCLPHVSCLVQISLKTKIRLVCPDAWAELLLRSSW